MVSFFLLYTPHSDVNMRRFVTHLISLSCLCLFVSGLNIGLLVFFVLLSHIFTIVSLYVGPFGHALTYAVSHAIKVNSVLFQELPYFVHGSTLNLLIRILAVITFIGVLLFPFVNTIMSSSTSYPNQGFWMITTTSIPLTSVVSSLPIPYIPFWSVIWFPSHHIQVSV